MTDYQFCMIGVTVLPSLPVYCNLNVKITDKAYINAIYLDLK